ncbi:uncharacterized protein LOC133894905 isoform X2 [Phragmites australis]|uniref:uncharacterized protein LOC133894905 isoform X2 n=1 Tax=Phragmites australis TaxID=29695 RepID=UPI002D7711CC|nr:uncharacterized protein LOC133894905 isoform X2 [Phragmites australis]
MSSHVKNSCQRDFLPMHEPHQFSSRKGITRGLFRWVSGMSRRLFIVAQIEYEIMDKEDNGVDAAFSIESNTSSILQVDDSASLVQSYKLMILCLEMPRYLQIKECLGKSYI